MMHTYNNHKGLQSPSLSQVTSGQKLCNTSTSVQWPT